MKKRLPLLILLFCSFFTFAFAQRNIKGAVTDKKNGDPLLGATITLKNESTGASTYTSVGLDGSFIFKNVEEGKYTVAARYVAYKTEEIHIDFKNTASLVVNFALEDKSSTLNEVSISARSGRETDQSALNAERRSDQLLNAVSARTIEVSPDITVANITQRVSGVSIERSNNGEGQYAIIRGMEKRYTYTLINGFKIPSPDNKNRYVPLDIFPADIIDRLEVYKSLTPSMEGDAIAGGINLLLKDAPDDFKLRYRIFAKCCRKWLQ